MAMNRVDRIVLDPNRTYACTRTVRTGVRVTTVSTKCSDWIQDPKGRLIPRSGVNGGLIK